MNIYRQNKYVGNPWLWLIVGIVLCASAFWAFSAKADHAPMHKVIIIGKMTEVPVRVMVCEDVNDAMSVPTAHDKQGESYGRAQFQALVLMGKCFIISGRITVVDVLYQKQLTFKNSDEKKNVYVVELKLEGMDETFYAPLRGPKIIRHGEKT